MITIKLDKKIPMDIKYSTFESWLAFSIKNYSEKTTAIFLSINFALLNTKYTVNKNIVNFK